MGGVFAKHTSRETKNFPSRKAFSQIPWHRGKKVKSSCKYPGSGKNERN